MTPQELREKSEELYDGLIMGWACHGDKVRNVKLVESFAREIRNEALEEAAKRCERESAALGSYGYISSSKIALSCATWIRAMKINVAEVLSLKVPHDQ